MFRAFALRIILPTLLSVALFVIAIFLVLLPAVERSAMERKREMIRELTTSAWNIFANLEEQVQAGELTREAAQTRAISQIQHLHYGAQMKDYFWINDMTPRMVAHPYRHDLVGKDLSDFADPTGKRLFVAMVETVRSSPTGEGFVQYQWQWKDDSSRVAPKLSFVKGFAPWGWIIGTGIYLEDVRTEVRRVTGRLASWSLAILGAVSLLLLLIVRQSWTAEQQRRKAEQRVRESEARYRTLVESAGESIFMELDDARLYANASALAMTGYASADLEGLTLADLVASEEPLSAEGAAEDGAQRHEAVLRRKDGSTLHALVTYSPMAVGPRRGKVLIATDITQRKQAERELGASEARLREEVAALRDRTTAHEATLDELRMTLMLTLMQQSIGDGAGLKILEDIRAAETAERVVALNQALPQMIKALVETGAKAALINRLITLNSDAVVQRLIELTVAEMGPPPAPFVFLIMGSEGRREQTLCTDQDNALLFGDLPEERVAFARAYFEQLGERVCDLLHEAGYAYCQGGAMAKNPRWCQPLSTWRKTFEQWIDALEAEDLLQAKIFFDFRAGYGDADLADELRATLNAALARRPRFFSQLARNVLLFVPPVGVFGQFQLEETPDGRRAVNIKAAMTPIVDFARIYALRHGVTANNTLQRLEALRRAEVLRDQNCQEIVEVYSALMQIRIENQVRCLAEGRPPDNFVEPAHLTHLEQRMLKESFTQIRHFQTRLGYDFIGMPEAPT